jgi:hypothetical protein
MHARLTDWPDGRIAMELAIARDEIAPLRDNLSVLLRDANQHFHLSSDDGREPCRLADVEIFIMRPGDPHNLGMTSVALAPGTEIRLGPRRWWIAPPRSLAVGVLAIAGVAAGLSAVGAAYVTYATHDYRPILVRGVWSCAGALLALHGSSLLAHGWKAKVGAMVLALAVLVPLGVILARLARL